MWGEDEEGEGVGGEHAVELDQVLGEVARVALKKKEKKEKKDARRRVFRKGRPRATAPHFVGLLLGFITRM